jgi:hypothetical protein
LLEVEDRQGTEQGEVLSRASAACATAILILSAIATVVLAIFDAPVIADGLEKLPRSDFVGPKAGDHKTDIEGFLMDDTLAQVLGVGLDAKELSGPRQAESFRIGEQMTDVVGGDATVSFLNLRP